LLGQSVPASVARLEFIFVATIGSHGRLEAFLTQRSGVERRMRKASMAGRPLLSFSPYRTRTAVTSVCSHAQPAAHPLATLMKVHPLARLR
jgi:hypothetical protein